MYPPTAHLMWLQFHLSATIPDLHRVVDGMRLSNPSWTDNK